MKIHSEPQKERRLITRVTSRRNRRYLARQLISYIKNTSHKIIQELFLKQEDNAKRKKLEDRRKAT